MNNASNAVIVGRICKPLEVKDVEVGYSDINDPIQTVGRMSIAVPKRIKTADGNYDEDVTYYEVTTWSTKQQEFLGKLRAGESVLVQGQLSAESYEKDNGDKGMSLHITSADVTPLGQNNIGKQNIVATGRVTHDITLQSTSGNHDVAHIPVAINHGNDKTTFVDVEVWDAQASAMAQFLHKGSLISVSGDININKYDRQDGSQGSSIRITNAKIGFLDKKSTEERTLPEPEKPAQKKDKSQKSGTAGKGK